VATPTAEETSVGLGEPRSRSELVLEMIALRHQIAVLKRSGTRRPCFGLWDRAPSVAGAGTVIRYDTCFTPGGFQVPSPTGRIEGGVVLGQ
jgi:hypothetical protein